MVTPPWIVYTLRMANEDSVPEKDNPYAQFYVVKSGDTLSKIAEEFYGDKMLYDRIFNANRDVLQDPHKIKPGQKLLIP